MARETASCGGAPRLREREIHPGDLYVSQRNVDDVVAAARMSPTITIPTDRVSAIRRELSRMESRRRWPLTWRSGREAGQVRTARIQLGAAMLEAMQHGHPAVTVDLGDANDLVLEALDRVGAAPSLPRIALVLAVLLTLALSACASASPKAGGAVR